MPTKTTLTNMCFLVYFEERLCRQKLYFLQDNLYVNATFFVSKNALCQRNCVLYTKLVRIWNWTLSAKLVRQLNNILQEKGTYTDKTKFYQQELLPMRIWRHSHRCKKMHQHNLGRCFLDFGWRFFIVHKNEVVVESI